MSRTGLGYSADVVQPNKNIQSRYVSLDGILGQHSKLLAVDVQFQLLLSPSPPILTPWQVAPQPRREALILMSLGLVDGFSVISH